MHEWKIIFSTGDTSKDTVEQCAKCDVVRHDYTHDGERPASYPVYHSSGRQCSMEPVCNDKTVPAAAWLKSYLCGWANQMAARFGHPIYIVGSALTKHDPRDVDVVCILPDDEFLNRYDVRWEECQLFGDIGEKAKKWYADMAKLSANAQRWHPAVNMDFKVQAASWVDTRSKDKPRLRIDTVAIDDTEDEEERGVAQPG